MKYHAPGFSAFAPESVRGERQRPASFRHAYACGATPNLPTKIVPTNIARVKHSGKSPMDMRIPPLRIKNVLESNLPKSSMLVGRLGVVPAAIERASAC